MQLQPKDFERIKTHMLRLYGINLEKKEALVISRLSQLALNAGFHTFSDYVDAAFKNTVLMQQMVTKLTTNYTYFMREEKHYHFLTETALPELAQTNPRCRNLKVWSAGCSSGDEAYTTAVVMHEWLGQHWKECDFNVVGSDISHDMLVFARRGIYTEDALKGMPELWRNRYFAPAEPGTRSVSPELSRRVRFQELNLMQPFPSAFQNFNIIFCRNVMIYFTMERKVELLRRFYDALAPGGYLFIGTSETMPPEKPPFRYLSPAIYQKER